MAESIRDYWDDFSEAYEKLNEKLTIQCARTMHSHLQLEKATSILEIACASGIGTQDILKYVSKEDCQILSTDYSTKMIEQFKVRMKDQLQQIEQVVKVAQANSEQLVGIPDASKDRYIASLCLQLVNDPDAMLREAQRVLKKGGLAGFTIWGRPEHSLMFPPTHKNFEFGKDISNVRKRFREAGFDRVTIWPFMMIAELWDASSLLDMIDPPLNNAHDPTAEELEARKARLEKMQHHLDSGNPLGLETYIIIASVSS